VILEHGRVVEIQLFFVENYPLSSSLLAMVGIAVPKIKPRPLDSLMPYNLIWKSATGKFKDIHTHISYLQPVARRNGGSILVDFEKTDP
jgi:hypothetical protein